MKNFVFLSPNFPETYWMFCNRLKENGMRVLGIGDCPYDNLKQELRDSLHEYYKVSNLENYDEVFRAVAFFTLLSNSTIFAGIRIVRDWSPSAREIACRIQ